LTDPTIGDVLGTSAGISVRVKDALGLDQTFTWAPGDCRTTSSGTVRCVSRDHSLAKFKPFAQAPELFRFSITMRHLSIHPPFAEPVTATLTDESTIREALVDDCGAVTGAGLLCL